MIVTRPIRIGLVGKISSDSAFSKQTKTITYDIVFGAQGDAGIVHHIAAVLKQRNAGDASVHCIALQNAQDLSPFSIGELLVGVQSVSRSDGSEDSVIRISVSSLDFSNGASSFDCGVARFLGSSDSSPGGSCSRLLSS